ncbi:MAG: hypothetical protein ACKERG_01305 [Candidatus Hodgkinia cicadicola]
MLDRITNCGSAAEEVGGINATAEALKLLYQIRRKNKITCWYVRLRSLKAWAEHGSACCFDNRCVNVSNMSPADAVPVS